MFPTLPSDLSVSYSECRWQPPSVFPPTLGHLSIWRFRQSRRSAWLSGFLNRESLPQLPSGRCRCFGRRPLYPTGGEVKIEASPQPSPKEREFCVCSLKRFYAFSYFRFWLSINSEKWIFRFSSSCEINLKILLKA